MTLCMHSNYGSPQSAHVLIQLTFETVAKDPQMLLHVITKVMCLQLSPYSLTALRLL